HAHISIISSSVEALHNRGGPREEVAANRRKQRRKNRDKRKPANGKHVFHKCHVSNLPRGAITHSAENRIAVHLRQHRSHGEKQRSKSNSGRPCDDLRSVKWITDRG